MPVMSILWFNDSHHVDTLHVSSEKAPEKMQQHGKVRFALIIHFSLRDCVHSC